MGDHWHTFTITDALGDGKEGVNYHPPHLHARRTPGVLPSQLMDTVPTTSVTAVDTFVVFESSSLHTRTTTWPLTTKSATTITTSGITTTIPARVVPTTEDNIHAYPADGCWDDPKCWYSRTHTEATPTATNSAINGHDTQARKPLKDVGPWVGVAIGVLVLILIGIGPFLYSRIKRKRQQGAKERQSKRMGDGEETPRAGSDDAPIQLQTMNGEQDRPQPERTYTQRYFGGLSEDPIPKQHDRRNGSALFVTASFPQ
ncbi:MAG: hypothetical protein Q9166_008150 [cf. Caloplaca sp. 2 TL-2023]